MPYGILSVDIIAIKWRVFIFIDTVFGNDIFNIV